MIVPEAIGAFCQLENTEVVDANETIAEIYLRNVTGLARRVPLVLRPGGERDVREIVLIANRYKLHVYPLSVGKNWGLGSKLPVTDGCVVMDLSRMAAIREINEVGRYALLEPGVTQRDLAARLAIQCPDLTFNLTGAFAGTSIVGNVLDRGDGGRARIDDLLGLSGVLGDGSPFSVGGHAGASPPAAAAFVSRYGAGPDLVGLFSQSNYAVVTCMAFRLLPRPERRYIVWGTVQGDRLGETVSTLAYLGDQRVFDIAGVNLGYANRFVQARQSMLGAVPGPDEGPEWRFYVVIDGHTSVADHAHEVTRRALRGACVDVGSHRVVDGPGLRQSLPPFLQPLADPLVGRPDEESIKLIYRATGLSAPVDNRDCDVDQTPFGMKCCVPVVPFAGECVADAAARIDRVRCATVPNMKASFFGDGRTLVTIHFRSDDAAEVARAEQAEAALWDTLIAGGYHPYRLAIDQMARAVAARPEYFELVARIKDVLDPAGTIAPGRYSVVSRVEASTVTAEPTTRART